MDNENIIIAVFVGTVGVLFLWSAFLDWKEMVKENNRYLKMLFDNEKAKREELEKVLPKGVRLPKEDE